MDLNKKDASGKSSWLLPDANQCTDAASAKADMNCTQDASVRKCWRIFCVWLEGGVR